MLYFDNNASTFVDPLVQTKMMQVLNQCVGNPSSGHRMGQLARAALTEARQKVAAHFCVDSTEILFTSGGTEGLNLIINGFVKGGGHLITTQGEHAAVYNTVGRLEEKGVEVTYLPLSKNGAADPEDLLAAIRPDTRLIVAIAANNETGVKTNLSTFADIAYQSAVPLALDAVGWVGKEPFELHRGVTAVCASGHKLHASKGVGFVYLRRGHKLEPFILGGTQERSLRGGTENLPGIAGIAEALCLPDKHESMACLRDRLETNLLQALPDVLINGEAPRIANTTNLAFMGVDGETLVMSLDMEGLCASHGAACSTGALEPSRVLLAMGLGKERAESSLRLSLSRYTTAEEVDKASEIIVKVVNRLRTKRLQSRSWRR